MFLHFLAMAQPQGQGGGQGGGSMGVLGFLPWIMIILVFYFLLIRPQAKKQKQHQAMLQRIGKGDKVVTAGGIHGTVVGVKESDTILVVKIADTVKIEVERSSIGRVTQSAGGE